MKIPKKLAEKYSVVIDNKRLMINNPDGRHNTCIGVPINKDANIVNTKLAWEIYCKPAMITLWKNIHRTHITIF